MEVSFFLLMARSFPEPQVKLVVFINTIEYKDFYLLLRDRGIFYFLKDIIMDTLGPKAEYLNFGTYTAAFIANGIYGCIEECFLRGMQESGEEMTKLLKSRNI